ncbi:Bro-N domain-containing protein, partial [Fructobacillus tropaeoli]
MANEVKAFNFESNEVRTVLVDNEPWFVGKDVAKTLGYADVNKAIVMHVDDEDKKLNDKTSPSFGQRGAHLINESGVYALIFGSKLDSAKRFKKWVTSEVLPSIRKHGAYMTDLKIEEALTDPDTIIRLATTLK